MLARVFEHVIAVEELTGLDPAGVLGRVEAARAAVVEAEFEELTLWVHWVGLHAPAEEAEARAANKKRRPGWERFVESGAAGTPLVGEFAVAELAAVAGRSPLDGRRLVGDAVNLRYRHPCLWQALAGGRGRVWQARQDTWAGSTRTPTTPSPTSLARRVGRRARPGWGTWRG